MGICPHNYFIEYATSVAADGCRLGWTGRDQSQPSRTIPSRLGDVPRYRRDYAGLPPSKGAINAPNLVVLLLVADAARNALSANYNSIAEGAIVVGTLFFWAFVLDTLEFYSRPL